MEVWVISSCGGFEESSCEECTDRDRVWLRERSSLRVWDCCTWCRRAWEDGFYWDFFT
jgi:hypothetical protein